MGRWTKEGWDLLENIAFNAYLFTGFKASARKVMEDAKRTCLLIETHPGIGKSIQNILGEELFWHPFNEGKVLIWKFDDEGIIFVGAFHSLPEVLNL